MKALLPLMLLVCVQNCGRAEEVLVRWNFNSTVPDGDTGTGSIVASQGNGTASLLGGINPGFAAGCTNDPGVDNSGWNTSSYPSQGTSNKLAGVQFAVSTLGYSGITICWDQRVSSTASKYYRLQYSTDGVQFVDCPQPVVMQNVSTRSSYYESQTNRLDWCPEVENCAGFTFRIVSEFESSAIGGVDEYATTYATNNYSRAGTVRFDMVTVLGTPIPGANTAPTITGPTNQTLRVEHTAGPLPVTVSDNEDPPEALVVSAKSSNQAALPDGNIWFEGSGANRTVTVLAGGEAGTAVVTLCVTDTGSRSNTTSFVVTVLPLNTPPFISTLERTNTLAGVTTPPLPFVVGDLETPATGLLTSAHSLNSSLVPDDLAHILVGGLGSNRTVTIVPSPGQSGVAPIRLTVSDGLTSTDTMLPLLVRPSEAIVFYDPFDYPDGSLLTNSGFLWDHRSGTYGQCAVTNGQLQLSSSQTEDVIAPLVNAPYARSNHTVLYAGFRARFLSLPRTVPGLFAHFADGSVLRGRIYAGTTNAVPGEFRIFVANGSETNTMVPVSLSTNVTYSLVTRYELDEALTTLWVDPATEGDAATTASDPQSATPIAAYGFRQDTDVGATVLIDDLRVGLTFASALPAQTSLSPIPLRFQVAGNSVVLSWSNAAFHLQAGPAPGGPFTNCPGAASPFTTWASGQIRYFRLAAP